MTMKRTTVLTFGLLVLGLAAAPALGAEPLRGLERSTDDWIGLTPNADTGQALFVANGGGFQQVPAVLTDGRVQFRARMDATGTIMDYELRYMGLAAPAMAALLHIGQPGVVGSEAVLLCAEDLPGAVPPSAPICPAGDAVVTGSIMTADILPPASSQGVHDLDELYEAMLARITYVNVYTHAYSNTGEVRAQVNAIRLVGGGGPLGQGGGDLSDHQVSP